MNNKISIQKTFKRSLGKASLVLLILGLFSCSTKKQILYLQDIDTYNKKLRIIEEERPLLTNESDMISHFVERGYRLLF